MEDIILKLLSPDTSDIQQGTLLLREICIKPEFIQILCQVLVTSNNPQVRQYSAILLKKRYKKKKEWSSLKEPVKLEFKAALLQALVQEPEKSVKNSIAQLIGVIIKHELPHNGWPDVLQFIHQQIESENLLDQEFGMYVLATITEIAPEAYLPHITTIMDLLKKLLNNLTEAAYPVASYVLETMFNLAPLIEGNQLVMNAYHELMPQVIQAIQVLAIHNQEKAIKGFELLDELCEVASAVITPRVKCLVEMCLFIINNPAFDEDLKMNSVIFIGCLVKTKKKSIMKHQLLEPIIDMLFIQMSLKPDDEEKEIYFTGEHDKKLITCATQTLDLLALHLPAEKLINSLLNHIETALKGTNIYAKKASYLAMAVLAEGCSECIRSKFLQPFLQCICQGITNSESVVRNAALFALGQFSEYLQPDISRFSEEILPILFNFLSQISTEIQQGKKDLPAADRIFYALEIFAENLNEELLPYLSTLMPTLFKLLEEDNCPNHVRELALSAIGAAANASKEHLLPYFEKIINLLHYYIVMENPCTENEILQAQAVDTLGTLARNIGRENFAPLAMKSLELSIQLLQKNHDPDLRKSVFGLLASVSIVMKEEMSEVLPTIIPIMITSIQSSDGTVTCLKRDENGQYSIFEDLIGNDNDEEDIENTDNEDEDDDDDDEDLDLNVENAYMEEKEEAILALKEIAEHTNITFSPYLKESFEEVFKIINYLIPDIRKAAVEALTQFCINFSKVDSNQYLQKALITVIPKLSELIRLDEERSVVVVALDSCSELLDQLKFEVLRGEGHKEAIINCITDVMLDRTECQDQDDGDGGNDAEAEHDELLFESAGQLLINLGKALPNEDFTQIMKIVFPIFIKRLTKNNSESQRSYIIGTMAECFPLIKDKVRTFASDLYPIFINFTNDPCDEVRSNAIFGLGELAFYGKEIIYPQYLQILQILSNSISKETNVGVRDNTIGALARMISTNYSLIPLDQVFPVYLSHLPLKGDLAENKTVFNSIIVLYKNGHQILRSHLNSILRISMELLENTNTDNETKEIVIEFLKPIQKDFLDEWNFFFSSYPKESLVELQKILL